MRPHGALYQVAALADGQPRPPTCGNPDYDADHPGYDPCCSNRDHYHVQHYTFNA